jgi:hypothetical protein
MFKDICFLFFAKLSFILCRVLQFIIFICIFMGVSLCPYYIRQCCHPCRLLLPVMMLINIRLKNPLINPIYFTTIIIPLRTAIIKPLKITLTSPFLLSHILLIINYINLRSVVNFINSSVIKFVEFMIVRS